MLNRPQKNNYRIFAFRRLKVTDMHWLSGWLGTGGPQSQAIRETLQTALKKYYHHLWHSQRVNTWVMTLNRRPVLCLTLLRLTDQEITPPFRKSGCRHQLYLLASPSIHQNDRKLMLAWQASSVHAFLKMGLTCVQVHIHDSQTAENDALLMLGYYLVGISSEEYGTINVYECRREDFRPVL
jgi:hypothetical protein